MLKQAPHRPVPGYTLIELVITLAVLALIIVASEPALTTWVVNARVRSGAEQLLASLRLAQSEALRRNRQAVLALTNATPAVDATPAANGRNWFVRVLPALAGETITDAHYVQGTSLPSSTRVSITGPALTCFNAIGRPVANSATGLGANCSAPAGVTSPIEYAVTTTGASRPLRVQVGLGGQLRLCDPARTRSSSAPDGC